MKSDLSLLEKDSLTVAPSLLGWKLIHQSSEGVTAGIIIETEAYREDDPASHSFRGITERTAPMFAKSGTIYVYISYGIHYCMNIVCGAEGHGEAVLIRALKPIEGISLMQARRGTNTIGQLCNGPGKLTQAMGITKVHNFTHIKNGPLRLIPGLSLPFTATPRIGISKAIEQPWRFVAK